MYISIYLRRLAVFVLILLPFAGFPATLWRYYRGGISENIPPWMKFLSYLDEASFLIFLFLALGFVCLKPWSFKFPRIQPTKWLLLFMGFGFLMGAVKRVPAAQASFGIYDVTKNILVLYLFAIMKFTREEFLATVKLLVKIGIILAIVGLVGVALAWTVGWGMNLLAIESGRIIPYQPISLTGWGTHNYLGIYAILLFFLSYGLRGTLAKTARLSLFMLIINTVSRQTWMGFLTVYPLYKKKRYVILLLPFLFAVIVYTLGSKIELSKEQYFRLFSFHLLEQSGLQRLA